MELILSYTPQLLSYLLFLIMFGMCMTGVTLIYFFRKMARDVKSCYNATRAFVPLLQKSESSNIVNMSSGLAFGGQANYGPYTNAKSSIISLSRTLATELAPTIRVNTVAPGAVDTAFIYNEKGKTRFDRNCYNAITPLASMAQPEEIAEVIVFLLSEGARHITGQCIHVNGGAMMR